MIVAGRVDMADSPSEEARKQLALRYRHGALIARSFVDAGFVAVHADNIYGTDDEWLCASSSVGLWVDSSDSTPEQTVDEIVDRWGEANVEPDQLSP